MDQYAECLFDFVPSNAVQFQGHQLLGLTRGDVVIVVRSDASGWSEGRIDETSNAGWFPTNYVSAPLVTNKSELPSAKKRMSLSAPQVAAERKNSNVSTNASGGSGPVERRLSNASAIPLERKMSSEARLQSDFVAVKRNEDIAAEERQRARAAAVAESQTRPLSSTHSQSPIMMTDSAAGVASARGRARTFTGDPTESVQTRNRSTTLNEDNLPLRTAVGGDLSPSSSRAGGRRMTLDSLQQNSIDSLSGSGGRRHVIYSEFDFSRDRTTSIDEAQVLTARRVSTAIEPPPVPSTPRPPIEEDTLAPLRSGPASPTNRLKASTSTPNITSTGKPASGARARPQLESTPEQPVAPKTNQTLVDARSTLRKVPITEGGGKVSKIDFEVKQPPPPQQSQQQQAKPSQTSKTSEPAAEKVPFALRKLSSFPNQLGSTASNSKPQSPATGNTTPSSLPLPYALSKQHSASASTLSSLPVLTPPARASNVVLQEPPEVAIPPPLPIKRQGSRDSPHLFNDSRRVSLQTIPDDSLTKPVSLTSNARLANEAKDSIPASRSLSHVQPELKKSLSENSESSISPRMDLTVAPSVTQSLDALQRSVDNIVRDFLTVFAETYDNESQHRKQVLDRVKHLLRATRKVLDLQVSIIYKAESDQSVFQQLSQFNEELTECVHSLVHYSKSLSKNNISFEDTSRLLIGVAQEIPQKTYQLMDCMAVNATLLFPKASFSSGDSTFARILGEDSDSHSISSSPALDTPPIPLPRDIPESTRTRALSPDSKANGIIGAGKPQTLVDDEVGPPTTPRSYYPSTPLPKPAVHSSDAAQIAPSPVDRFAVALNMDEESPTAPLTEPIIAKVVPGPLAPSRRIYDADSELPAPPPAVQIPLDATIPSTSPVAELAQAETESEERLKPIDVAPRVKSFGEKALAPVSVAVELDDLDSLLNEMLGDSDLSEREEEERRMRESVTRQLKTAMPNVAKAVTALRSHIKEQKVDIFVEAMKLLVMNAGEVLKIAEQLNSKIVRSDLLARYQERVVSLKTSIRNLGASTKRAVQEFPDSSALEAMNNDVYVVSRAAVDLMRDAAPLSV